MIMGVFGQQGGQAPKDIYAFQVPDIEGKKVPLSKYKGKVILVVNTASLCGLTPQYAGLQNLYTTYEKKGFVVLGFPANDFRNQEPGSNKEIQEFCQTKYGVTFPMFSKVKVLGPDKEPLFAWLQANSDKPNLEIEWNFNKYLIDRNGTVRYRFAPRETPDSKVLISRIEKLVGEKAR